MVLMNWTVGCGSPGGDGSVLFVPEAAGHAVEFNSGPVMALETSSRDAWRSMVRLPLSRTGYENYQSVIFIARRLQSTGRGYPRRPLPSSVDAMGGPPSPFCRQTLTIRHSRIILVLLSDQPWDSLANNVSSCVDRNRGPCGHTLTNAEARRQKLCTPKTVEKKS
ncbi:hypothetical protein LX36DRAFT_332892 [Colletotrichum falcatum]|nr:hypothetical protein LX36DRAFT_332892 [Colletotrichum falcatum]